MTCIFASAPVVEKKPDPNTSKTITAPKLGQWTLRSCTIGALIIRIGFGGIFYYIYNKEPPPPTIVLVIMQAPIFGVYGFGLKSRMCKELLPAICRKVSGIRSHTVDDINPASP